MDTENKKLALIELDDFPVLLGAGLDYRRLGCCAIDHRVVLSTFKWYCNLEWDDERRGQE